MTDLPLKFAKPQWDAARSVSQDGGGAVAPRTDIAPPENCYVALQVDGTPFGLMQQFKDGSWGYWQFPGEQAKPAPTMEEAFKRLSTITLQPTKPVSAR